jgi:hypothetical protein
MTLSTAGSTPLDTSDTDSVFTTTKQGSAVVGFADEPPTDLPRSRDKQVVLHLQEDKVKAGIF